jgi:diguanylate cyclase (GGDEF)-like protein
MLNTFSFDPRTAFLIATVMMLLNGAVLGFMHKELADEVKPSAVSWRIGTLLVAAGSVLLAVQDFLPAWFVLPLGNFAALLGLYAYLRAIYQFNGQTLSRFFLLPVFLGAAGIYWFAAVNPDLNMRIHVASLAALILLLQSAWSLRRTAVMESSTSQRVLAIIFLLMGIFMFLRAGYFLLIPSHDPSLLVRTSILHAITPLVIAILPVIGTTAYLLMCSDRMRRRWEFAASTDYLTGLANRRTAVLAGERAFSSAQRQGNALSVAVVDADFFKNINDRYGHDIGDLALKHIADRLVKASRKNDLVARHGGEEFIVLLDQAGSDEAIAAAQRLRESVQDNPLPLPTAQLPMTVSIGLAVMDAKDQDFDDVLRRADQALYLAKTLGRNRVELAKENHHAN